MTSVAGRVVWITGASAGIGEGLARAMAAKGAKLALSARNAEALEALRRELDHPQAHLCVPLDVTNDAAVQAAADHIGATLGRVEVLVANAGVTQRSEVAETTVETYRRLMDINFFGVVSAVRAVLPAMLDAGQGHIAATSSVVGKYGSPLRSGYSASKHAVHGFLDSLRAEVHDRGVRVTVVCPGFVATDISTRALVGDGSAYGVLDEKQQQGISVDECVRRYLGAIETETAEVVMGGLEAHAVRIARYAPWLFRHMIRRAAVR